MDKSVQDPTPRCKFAQLEAPKGLVPMQKAVAGSLTTSSQLEPQRAQTLIAQWRKQIQLIDDRNTLAECETIGFRGNGII